MPWYYKKKIYDQVMSQLKIILTWYTITEYLNLFSDYYTHQGTKTTLIN